MYAVPGLPYIVLRTAFSTIRGITPILCGLAENFVYILHASTFNNEIFYHKNIMLHQNQIAIISRVTKSSFMLANLVYEQQNKFL